MKRARQTAAPTSPGTAKPKRRRRRRWVLATLCAIAIALAFLLRPESLGRLLLAQIASHSDFRVVTAEPARLGIWPDLHLTLKQAQVYWAGDAQPLLGTDALEVVLPWSTLGSLLGSGGDAGIDIRSLRLLRPDIDLRRIAAILPDAEQGPPSPFVLPSIDSPIEISDGRARLGFGDLQHIELSLSPLKAGQLLKVRLALDLPPATTEEMDDARHWSLQASLVPNIDTGDLSLTALDLQLDSQDFHFPLKGRLRLSPTRQLKLALHSQLDSWPTRLPKPPIPGVDGGVEIDFGYTGDLSGSGDIRLEIATHSDRIEGRLEAHGLLDWWQTRSTQRDPLPPLKGELHASHLEREGLLLDNVTLEFDDSTPAGDAGNPP